MSVNENLGLGLETSIRSIPWQYRWACLMTLIGLASITVYWLRYPLSETYLSGQKEVLSALGLTILPSVFWTVSFAWAIALRRNWLRKFNYWLGTFILLPTIAGSLAFFQPNEGILELFTVDRESVLGGDLGRFVAGTNPWTGTARVLGLFIVSVWMAFPSQSTTIALSIIKSFLFVKVMLTVASKSLVSALQRMYRFDVHPAVDKIQPNTHLSKNSLSGQKSSNLLHKDTYRQSVTNDNPNLHEPDLSSDSNGMSTKADLVDQDDYSKEACSSKPNLNKIPFVAESTPASHGTNLIITDDCSKNMNSEISIPEKSVAGNGKFNRFWQSSDGEEKVENQTTLDTERTLQENVKPWELPSLDLLVGAEMGGISKQEMDYTAETIRRTLEEYGVEVKIGQIRPGPAVTMYGLIPGWIRRYKQVKQLDNKGHPKLDASGKIITTREETKTRVKVDSILSREKDLALALKTPRIRIETPVMGKAQVGIEVPNPESALVALRNLIDSTEFQKLRVKAKLPIPMGKASGGETIVVDLAKMPHLLIAGATGAGKSVFINTIVSCLIMEKNPAEMKLLLVDPKRVELTPYNGIPHLLTPVVVETDKVVGLLKGLIQEMFDRYRRMEEVGVRNIDGYNDKMPEKMPLLVLAIDELADLMMSAAFDVEQSLCRLAQLGRATGIHLIVATQRPSVDVVTGLIKANFPTRVSFSVTSQIDSRTILDSVGAEKLLGRGDMLYLAQDASRPERVQGVFISDKEIQDIVAFWQTTHWRPLPKIQLRSVETVENPDGNGPGNGVTKSVDELIPKALELAQIHSKISTSLLQRRLRIGYPRAARLMDQLEEEGIVGPSDGSKSRDVIPHNA